MQRRQSADPLHPHHMLDLTGVHGAGSPGSTFRMARMCSRDSCMENVPGANGGDCRGLFWPFCFSFPMCSCCRALERLLGHGVRVLSMNESQ